MATVFFSYAHEDEDYRNELEIHLSMLKRQGVISTWHDRRIHVGSEIDVTISQQLEQADIILLLVSPYFLASEYCNNVELRRAMERHENGNAVVVPVILHPCDWTHAPFGSLLACPRDGKPVSKHANVHEAFLDITLNIRKIAESNIRSESPAMCIQDKTVASARHPERSSNLRIRKTFTDREVDDFREDSFRFILAFFENSLAEMEARNVGLESRLIKRDGGRFTAAIYIKGKKMASCSIWIGDQTGFPGAICYSHGDSTFGSGFNESLSIETDGYVLGLRAMGISRFAQSREILLTRQGGAELLWELLVESLQ